MNLTRILLGTAAAMMSVGAAQAADLPSRKSAPVEYVKVCNAYGAGFFYIPGTDTCLKIGGNVTAETRVITPIQRAVSSSFATRAPGLPAVSNLRRTVARDAYGTTALGCVELDARTQTAWGTLRSFIRIDSVYANGLAATGTLNQGSNAVTPVSSRETTYINKAFIQFAGITAGRAQSMFDLYADAYNYEGIRGSNATTNLLAYTATFGGGFSATLSLEDEVARRTTYATTRLTPNVGTSGGTRIPDVVAALRVDQAWGTAQLSAAMHRTSSIDDNGAGVVLGSDRNTGYAVQGGVKINLPMLAKGDALYLQAAYSKGAYSYIGGSNLTESQGFNNERAQGNGSAGLNSNPLYGQGANDCIFTAAGKCEQGKGFAIVAALKHYWTPTISQNFYVSYMQWSYSAAARAGQFGGVASVIGFSSQKELRLGSVLIWTPVKGFDIGLEGQYMTAKLTRPGGLATDAALVAAGFPAFKGANQFEGRLRFSRSF